MSVRPILLAAALSAAAVAACAPVPPGGYGPLGRSNFVSPGLRLEVTP